MSMGSYPESTAAPTKSDTTNPPPESPPGGDGGNPGGDGDNPGGDGDNPEPLSDFNNDATVLPNDQETHPPIKGSDEPVFVCTDDGVQVVDPPSGSVTTIKMNVGYLAESTASLDVYRDDLEYMILRTAIIGALQCATGGPVFGGGTAGTQYTANVPIQTEPTDEQCDTEFPGTTCTVYETKFQFLIEKSLDPEPAAFLGYVYLQEEMNESGAFHYAVPVIDRIEYLRPLPLLPPIIIGGVGGGQLDPSSGQTGLVPSSGQTGTIGEDASLNVSPWTLGAALAICKCFREISAFTFSSDYV